MNRKFHRLSAGAVAAIALAACSPALATPFDKCGTFVPGTFENCVLFQPDDGSQHVWIGQLPSGFNIGDHARVSGDYVLCPSPCMAACVIGSTVSQCLGACPADFDGSGALTTNDIFAFLGTWFGGGLSADFDHSGALGVPDIFAFINAWFAGC